MPKSSKLDLARFRPASLPVAMRDPRVAARVIVGTLVVLNLAAALFAFRPWADSPEQLAQRLSTLRQQAQQRRAQIERLRILAKKSEQALNEGEKFLSTYFLARRTASSTLVSELNTMAKAAGVKYKEHSFSSDPVEGSDNLSMVTITANYEGSYADLVQYINRLDRSPRFFILETLTATPQQNSSGMLNISLKVNVFVREEMLPDGQPVESAVLSPGAQP